MSEGNFGDIFQTTILKLTVDISRYIRMSKW